MDDVSSTVGVSRSARVLFAELRKLHIRAGEPSSRETAAAIGGMSHSSVNNAIRGRRVPSWPILSKIVKQLGGDENLFRGLWSAVREEGIEAELLPTPTAAHRPGVSVFVSYASIDERATHGRIGEIVDGIRDQYESLTGEQVGVFLDKSSLSAGDNWRDTIRFELSSSAIFLAFLSPSYIRSVECNNEFWEFYRFLEANSSERLIIPLLFGDRERTAGADPSTSLWNTAKELHIIDVGDLRTAEPGRTVWLEKTEKIAETIDSALRSVQARAAARPQEASTAQDDEDTAPMLLEQMLHFEEIAPEFVVVMEDLKDSLFKVGSQVNGAGPLMRRATTTKRRLSVSRQLAHTIDPIANDVNDQVDRFLQNLQVWDVTVKTVFDHLRRRDESQLLEESVTSTLNAVAYMADTGMQVFGEAEGMHTAIGQGRGLSRELDEPLKKLQSASLRLANSRAIFATWKAGAEEFLNPG